MIFLQHIKSIPVFEGSVQVHINPQGQVTAYKDFRLAEVSVELEPKIAREEAIELVRLDIGPNQTIKVPRSRLVFFRDRKNKLHLAWQIESIFASGFAGRFHFIDAHTGEQLYKFSQIRAAFSIRDRSQVLSVTYVLFCSNYFHSNFNCFLSPISSIF